MDTSTYQEVSSPEEAVNELSFSINKIKVYRAGLPRFLANFTRDSILSAILFQNRNMLREQLIYNSFLQGTKSDPFSGEEPGKISHEIPPFRQGKYTTAYNACDTTALFLYGHEIYLRLSEDIEFIRRQKPYLEKAVVYILSHIVNDLFFEDPKYSGGKKFLLHTTYWKDSDITNRKHGTPVYPVVYTLAHVQNMRGLRSAALLLNAPDLLEKATKMINKLSFLFHKRKGVFSIGYDTKGFFPGISSDNLHMLYYLELDDLPKNILESIVKNTKVLESSYGYLTLNLKDPWLKHDITKHIGYHSNTVWPFEQAFIHIGAKRFKLSHVQKVAERIIPHLDTYAEYFKTDGQLFQKNGNPLQLWSIAAKEYFSKLSTP